MDGAHVRVSVPYRNSKSHAQTHEPGYGLDLCNHYDSDRQHGNLPWSLCSIKFLGCGRKSVAGIFRYGGAFQLAPDENRGSRYDVDVWRVFIVRIPDH